jgi:hypothetical protein
MTAAPASVKLEGTQLKRPGLPVYEKWGEQRGGHASAGSLVFGGRCVSADWSRRNGAEDEDSVPRLSLERSPFPLPSRYGCSSSLCPRSRRAPVCNDLARVNCQSGPLPLQLSMNRGTPYLPACLPGGGLSFELSARPARLGATGRVAVTVGRHRSRVRFPPPP